MTKPSIVWLSQDLRLEDQPALQAAVEKGGEIIPLFIWSPEEEGDWAPGAASRWWLHHSLASLQKEFADMGSDLILRKGSYFKNLLELAESTEADCIFANRRYEPLPLQLVGDLKSELHKRGIRLQLFNGSLLFDPHDILTKQNNPYQVFTPFWKECLKRGEPALPLAKPKKIHSYKGKLKTDSLESFAFLPKIDWDKGFADYWKPGTRGANEKLKFAEKDVIPHYRQSRDIPSFLGTSRLSPHLHFGEITPKMIWHHLKKLPYADDFLRQIGWREFAAHLLYHFPHTATENLRPSFDAFPWEDKENGLSAWQKGTTGYPIVDAGMRQLWKTGWMHNRVRMIVGSFLVKDLMIHWREGARWFWDTLVDADLANNTLGWQWIAGCGADAAPYFRIFNPVLQGEKFDPEGNYVKEWVPELKLLPKKWIHKPWEAPEKILSEAQVFLGKNYPLPIIDHGVARERALKAFKSI